MGVLAAQRGYTITAMGGRNKEKVATAAWRIGPDVRACSMEQAAGAADLILISVSDDAIRPVSERLARQKAFATGSIIAHLSGALSSEELSAAREHCQCALASMHPLQTFPTVDAAISMLQGAYCFYEGDDKALPVIEGLAKTIGLKPCRIDKKAKTLYHASAVMACNYFISLMDSALAVAQQAGIDRAVAWPALEVLIKAATENIGKLGTHDSLTGPIARGDIDTVQRHLQQLAQTPNDLEAVYRVLGKYTAEMAAQKGTISPEKAKELTDLLIHYHLEISAIEGG